MLVNLCLSRNFTPFARALAAKCLARPEPFLPLMVSLMLSENGRMIASLGTVSFGAMIGAVSLNLTPFSTRNSNVGTFSSAQTRIRSLSLYLAWGLR